MPDKKFDLGDYVEVKDRIKLFYELYAGGRLVTGEVRLESGPDGKPRVLVQGLAYRTVDDPLPGVGWSWMELPGTTSYTKGSELENTETSAWGRAIAALGILVDRSIATRNEIDNKDAPEQPAEAETPADGSLIGTAAVGKAPSDFELRETPQGHVLSFRLSDGRKSIKVVAYDALAEALVAVRTEVIDERVQCWGTVSDETFRPKGSTKDITYQVLTLARIQTAEFVLPADEAVPDTIPLFDPADEAELDAALARVP